MSFRKKPPAVDWEAMASELAAVLHEIIPRDMPPTEGCACPACWAMVILGHYDHVTATPAPLRHDPPPRGWR